MRVTLAALPAGDRDARSRAIRIYLFPALRAVENLGLYASLPDEVATDSWLRERWRGNGPVFLPRMREDGALDFVRVAGESDLVNTRFGLREPRAELPAQPLHTLDTIVVPALAFCRAGVRLGRGGGYYDRTLAPQRFSRDAPRPALVGVAFAVQLRDALPHDDRDLRVDRVVTEHGCEVPR